VNLNRCIKKNVSFEYLENHILSTIQYMSIKNEDVLFEYTKIYTGYPVKIRNPNDINTNGINGAKGPYFFATLCTDLVIEKCVCIKWFLFY